mmetsp:Transcript_42304/g.111912  ORF Transcript_42304/g.111912 Transcript_42304/m.111912 type:complete len:351 (+) Transcript_42304:102-1154(+)
MRTFTGLLAFAALPHVGARTALLVVDVQDCFLEASTTSGQPGSLSVPASQIIPLINSMRSQKSCLFDEVIFTQDFHPANHISFGSSHGLAPFSHLGGKGNLPLTCLTPTTGNTAEASCCPTGYVTPSAVNCSTQLCPPDWFDYDSNNSALITGNTACATCRTSPGSCFETDQSMWTDHCIQTGDATFPPTLDKRAGDLVVQKGMNQYVDAYSAFMDNTQNLKTQLETQLIDRGIDTIFIAGIATDVCVKWTVRDALSSRTANYTVNVVTDATAAVLGDVTNYNSAKAYMEAAGATLYTTAQVLAMGCPATTTTAAPTTTSVFVSGSVSKTILPSIFFIIASVASSWCSGV